MSMTTEHLHLIYKSYTPSVLDPTTMIKIMTGTADISMYKKEHMQTMK